MSQKAIGGGNKAPPLPLALRRKIAGTAGSYGSVSAVSTGDAGSGAGTGGGGGTIIDDGGTNEDLTLRCTESGETRLTEGGVERRIE